MFRSATAPQKLEGDRTNPGGGNFPRRSRQNVKGSWDATKTTDENERHWRNADGLSARAAASPRVRQIFRNRARYEFDNNSYCQGIGLTIANHCIGKGPRLQVRLNDPVTGRIINSRISGQVELEFREWAEEIKLAEKLRTLRVARYKDGESFAFLTTNLGLESQVKLDLQTIEADQISTPTLTNSWTSVGADGQELVDGIDFDKFGNPTEYHRLKNHPGAAFFSGDPLAFDRIPAQYVIHRFRADRSSQARGLPEIATSLALFAMLRRFILATVGAAETAADFAAIMKTNGSLDDGAVKLGEDRWFDAIPIEYRALLTLPEGWDISQLKAEHPATTLPMFKKELLLEISRCVSVPYNIAACDSSGYNYSSGRLDHQVYYGMIETDQYDTSINDLKKIFRHWCSEAGRIPGYLPTEFSRIVQSAPPLKARIPVQWFWDAPADIDPTKTAAANTADLSNGTNSRANIYARKGLDVDEEDKKAAEGFAMTVPEYRKALADGLFKQSLPAQPTSDKKDTPPADDADDESPEDQEDPNDETETEEETAGEPAAASV